MMIWSRREIRLSGIPMMAAIILLMLGGTTWAQVPGLPVAPAPSKNAAQVKGPGPSEKTKPAVASTGPITVHRQVKDPEIERFLTKFLPKYPGVAQDERRRR